MEKNLLEAERILENDTFRQLFPVKSADDAAEVVIFLLSQGNEPNLALIYLFLPLVQISITGHGSSGKGRPKKAAVAVVGDFKEIQLDDVVGLWKKLKHVLMADTENVKRRRGRKRVRDVSPDAGNAATAAEDVNGIYTFVTKSIRHYRGGDKATSAVMGLIKFIDADWQNSLSPNEIKLVTAVLAKLWGMDDVHICLSETTVFLSIGKPDANGKGLLGIPSMESSFFPASSDGQKLPSIKDLFVCSGGSFVYCDAFMLVSYLICAMQFSYWKNGDELIGLFQRKILAYLYHIDKLNGFPMALSVYGMLDSHSDSRSANRKSGRAENSLRKAVEVNQEHYDNAFVYPYLFFTKYLIQIADFAAALVPIHLAAKAASRYVYAKACEVDMCLHGELLTLAEVDIPNIIAKTVSSGHPCIATLLLAFMDEIFLWEEKSSTLIFHITWGKALVPCLSKVMNRGLLRNVAVHVSSASYYRASSARAETPSSAELAEYFDSMLENLRNPPEALKDDIDSGTSLPKLFLENKDACLRVLDLYAKWPPLRAFDKGYISTTRRLLELPEPTSENFRTVLLEFEEFPSVDVIPGEDLELASLVRPLNPLYRVCHGHVFPFLDMGRPNIPLYCFNMKKIAAEIMVPQLGTPENHIIAALRQHVAKLDKEAQAVVTLNGNQDSPVESPVSHVESESGSTGSRKCGQKRVRMENGGATADESSRKLYAEIYLMSRKMQGIRNMLVADRFSVPEIHLKLEALDTSCTNERDRRRGTRNALD